VNLRLNNLAFWSSLVAELLRQGKPAG